MHHEELLGGRADEGALPIGVTDSFEYCWEQSKTPRTPSRPIPGHVRSLSYNNLISNFKLKAGPFSTQIDRWLALKKAELLSLINYS